ncbi:hypothetical protein V7122_16980 [Bacillus sp. JJ1532]|uniref:hypothetical protein n=1 Tax=Bacillus sp. JJ1532 TaxID=3122958 RepID=UPI003000A42E
MDWVSFISGAIGVSFAFALFSSRNEANDEDYEENEGMTDINESSSGRYVVLSCQTCRKMKKHREIEFNLFQCVKCKRHVDIRAS